MDARKGNIYEILNGNKQFLIPDYQRFYSWDLEQQQEQQKVFDEVIGYITKHDGLTPLSLLYHIKSKSQPFGLTFFDRLTVPAQAVTL